MWPRADTILKTQPQDFSKKNCQPQISSTRNWSTRSEFSPHCQELLVTIQMAVRATRVPLFESESVNKCGCTGGTLGHQVCCESKTHQVPCHLKTAYLPSVLAEPMALCSTIAGKSQGPDHPHPTPSPNRHVPECPLSVCVRACSSAHSG